MSSEKNKVVDVVVTLGILFLIVAMIYFGFVLATNLKEIKSDPLAYGLEKHNYTHCRCYDSEGRTWYLDEEGFSSKNPLLNK